MVDVPTMDLHLALQGQTDDLTDEVLALGRRVDALEAGGGTPEPPPADAHPSHPIIIPGLPQHPIVLPPEVPEPPEPGEDDRDLTACIVLGGVEHWFRETEGADLGDYVDPQGRFTQGCVEARCDTLPGVYVHFRRDRSADRLEVVFWAGSVFSGTTAVLPAYWASIFAGEVELVQCQVPQHPSYTRWRWQEWERPATCSVDDLVAAKLLPPYDADMLKQYQNDKGPQVYTIMGRAGLTPCMWQTGERPEIGPTTAHQADFICAGTNYESMLAQAEALGSFPVWHRDEIKCQPLDVVQYPNASFYKGNVGQDPLIVQPDYQLDGQPCGWDTGHEGALCYVPFLLTGDPYFLEGLQYQAHANLLACPPKSRYTGGGRYFAWPFRDMLEAWCATPGDVMPQWLRSKQHFRSLLENYRRQTETWMADPAPSFSLWHFFAAGGSQSSAAYPAGSYGSPWQESFTSYELGFAVYMGLEEYRPALEWKAQCDIMRCSDPWPFCNPAPYQWMYRAATTLAVAITPEQDTIEITSPLNFYGITAPFEITNTANSEKMLVIDGGEDKTTWRVERAAPKKGNANNVLLGPYYPDVTIGCEANFNAHPDKFPTMPGDDDGMTLLYVKKDPTYAAYLRGALELAAHLGVEGAAAALERLHEQMTDAVSGSYKWERKWCQSATEG